MDNTETQFGDALIQGREASSFETQLDIATASLQLEEESPDKFASFSQQWLSRLEADKTGTRLDVANPRKLKTLSYLLGWSGGEFEKRIGISIGTVPDLEDQLSIKLFSFLERYGDKADLRIRIPYYGTVAAGIKGFEVKEEPEYYQRFDPSELPKGADPTKLFLVKANGSSMIEENLARPVPHESTLLVEADALPEERQLVIAYIPERDLGVIKQFRRNNENVVLKSYRVGGPMFWASEYPEMRIVGVVRRISYEP